MRNSRTLPEKAFSMLAYAMPLVPAVASGGAFLSLLSREVPQLGNLIGALMLALTPLFIVESQPVVSLVIFILLYALVVRNESISRFIRFNVLQAIMLNITLSVLMIVLGLPGISASAVFIGTILNVIFFSSMTAIIYSPLSIHHYLFNSAVGIRPVYRSANHLNGCSRTATLIPSHTRNLAAAYCRCAAHRRRTR